MPGKKIYTTLVLVLFFQLFISTPKVSAKENSNFFSNIIKNIYCSFFWQTTNSCLVDISNIIIESENLKLNPSPTKILNSKGISNLIIGTDNLVIKGENGKDGVDGKNGINGTNGLNGLQGSKGEKGEKGDKGDDGEDGDSSSTNYQFNNGLKIINDEVSLKINGNTLQADVDGVKVNSIGSDQIESGVISNTHIASSANISWSKVNKVGALLTDFDVASYENNQNKYLKLNSSLQPIWDNVTVSSFETTVGPANSGADYETDGVADDVTIQSAITNVVNSGGGVIKILAGTYDIRSTILVPKNPKISIEGEYVTKSGYGGSELRVNSSVTPNLEAIIKESGDLSATTSNANHSHASAYNKLIFNGNSRSDVGLLLYNTDHTIVNESKFINVQIGIDGQFNGDVALADYAGGLRVESSSFLASNINIRLNSHTQDWITNSWFLGSPNTHIQFISSNKIHLSNNEFNQVSGQIFVFDDSASLHCGDINITGGFMDAGSSKNFWLDNRTNVNSKGVIVAGVRMVTGTKTKLFAESKDYNANTYTSANLSGGYINPKFDDDVILLNSSGAALPVQLPQASTAIKRILLKAINLTNPITIYPYAGNSIEKAGVLTSSYAFTEVNESVWLLPDSDKWRVLSVDLPSGGTSSGSSLESVIEVSSNYTIPVDKDIILVNAFSNPVTLTLPLKATKYAENRKNIVVKVISAVNTVTILASGSDQIDNTGQTSITINDLRSVTLIANSGSRWRTYQNLVVSGADKQIQFNNSGILGSNSNFVWDNTNSRLGVLASSPVSTLDIGGSLSLKRTAVSSSTSSGAQIILGVTDTSSPRTINLRTADMVTGRTYIIKDESGGANTNNITVATEGAEKIDGQDTYVINTNYGAVTIYSNGSNWFIISTK